MESTYKKQLGIMLASSLLLVSGCTTTPVQPLLPTGDIALIAARHPPEANLNVYALGKGKAAGELGKQGAGAGAVVGATVPLELGPVGIVAYPFIAPVTILAGAIIGGATGTGRGAIHGLPEADAEKVKQLVDSAVQQLGVHEQVANRVVERASRNGYRIDLIPDRGPISPKEDVDYSGLKSEYDGLLQLTLTHLGMAARKGEPPRIALEMKLHARVVNWVNPETSGVKSIEWCGRPRPISDWELGGGKLLEDELNQGYEALADYAWEMLFPYPGSIRLNPAQGEP